MNLRPGSGREGLIHNDFHNNYTKYWTIMQSKMVCSLRLSYQLQLIKPALLQESPFNNDDGIYEVLSNHVWWKSFTVPWQSCTFTFMQELDYGQPFHLKIINIYLKISHSTKRSQHLQIPCTHQNRAWVKKNCFLYDDIKTFISTLWR